MKLVTVIIATVVALHARDADAFCSYAWACGSNSATIDGHEMHELNTAGAQNAEGFAIAGFVKGSASFTPVVTNGRLTGLPPFWWLPRISGQGLVGAQLLISYFGTPAYVITITDVANATYATYPQDPIETYHFVWASMGNRNDVHDLCPTPPASTGTRLDDEAGDWTPFALRSHMGSAFTLLFEGDRINAIDKTISSTVFDTSWFNIGCAGHTLSKMHLTHNTGISRPGGWQATHDVRQAVLKMLVADYCRNGTPHTVTGVPLDWYDYNSVTYFAPAHTLEARWDAGGAMCVGIPRIIANPTPLSQYVFPGGPTCPTPIKICPNPDPFSADPGELVRSANP